MANASMDLVFRALAHPDRRRMLDIVRASPGCCVGELCDHFDMSRIGAMKHLRVLEEAQLVLSEHEGSSRLLYVNAAPIQMIQDRWLSEWSSLWASQVTQLKYRVEASGKSRAARSGRSGGRPSQRIRGSSTAATPMRRENRKKRAR